MVPEATGTIRGGLAGLFGPDVCNVVSIGAGYEAEVFSFHLGPEPRVLRLFHPSVVEAKATWEAGTMARLDHVGYPVPRLYGVGLPGDSPWNRPFLIMEWIDGSSTGPDFWGPPGPQRRHARDAHFSLMARLHRIDPSGFTPPVELDPVSVLSQQVAARPQLAEALDRTLEAISKAEGTPVLLHGDFHGGNVLRRTDGTCVVVDWSDAWFGDRRHDLAWASLLTFGDVGPDDLRAYGEDVGDLGPFEAFGAIKILADGPRARPLDHRLDVYLREIVLYRTGVRLAA